MSKVREVPVHAAAMRALERGWQPVPVRAGEKRPIMAGWTDFVMTREAVPVRFTADANIGLLLGTPSGGLVDLDLDCQEAVALAPLLLPETLMISGRSSTPRSHFWYITDTEVKTRKFTDPEGGVLLELRSTGSQTVIPPSVHPTGEVIEWVYSGEPAVMSARTMNKEAGRLAAAALLARYWPREASNRQDRAMALSGVLLRGGWSVPEAEAFIHAIAVVAGDEEADRRSGVVRFTAVRIKSDEPTMGWPTFAEYVGAEVADKVKEWLDLRVGGGDDVRQNSTRTDNDRMLELTCDIELWHTANGELYATVIQNGHNHHLSLETDGEAWLQRRFFEGYRRAAKPSVVSEVNRLLQARAMFDATEEEVHRRVANVGGRIYLDIADGSGRCVEISPCGWSVVLNPPVRFIRTKGMLPLPLPEPGGSIGLLRQFVNVEADSDWQLVLAWVVMTLRGEGPFPVLVLHGEQGSAKSTTTKVIRSLTDPSTASIRAIPSSERDMMIAANNAWVAAYDNISQLPEWFSDALCRLATGGGFSTRALYSNADEMIIDATRPIILNGIEDFVVREDLRDRALILHLSPIRPQGRRDEATFWRDFQSVQGRILGVLLDGVSRALRDLSTTKLSEKPRLADFALWATAAEPGLGLEKGSFMKALEVNRDAAIAMSIDSKPYLRAILTLVDNSKWEGTATELLEALEGEPAFVRDRGWPKCGMTLAQMLARDEPLLRSAGVSIERDRKPDRKRTRFTRLSFIQPDPSELSALSDPPETE
jgi:hypothetical protein